MLLNENSLSSLHHKILSANHGNFNDYIEEAQSKNPEKKSFTFKEFNNWLIEKEKTRQFQVSQEKKDLNLKSSQLVSREGWFETSSEKAFFLNRFYGHVWTNLYLRCSFIDEFSFCSTSEDGFLCVWNFNQSTPIQKQKISNFVLNDVAVQLREIKQSNSENDIEEEKNEKGLNHNGIKVKNT